MKITKNLFNEEVPVYETQAEQSAAVSAYVNGRFEELTTEEIEYFRNLERDPDMTRFNLEHAGQVAADVDPTYLAGMTFVFGDEILAVPHPITNWYLYKLEKELINE